MKADVHAMEALIERELGGQKRQDGSTNAMHARRVRALTVEALKLAGEMPPSGTDSIECAALGHDLLEDSQITAAAIEELCGSEALVWIQSLTNTWGDSHAEPYVAQMTAAQEEARLIKYADLTDNIFHASFGIQGLGLKWMKEYFLPIVDPMREKMDTIPFSRYPGASRILKMSSALARAHLEEYIRIYSA